MSLAAEIEDGIRTLAAISSTPGALTRLAFTPEMAVANETVAGRMRDAGMGSRLDGAGNVVGRYESEPPGGRALLLGSHLDTVGDAGRYDGILGVVTAIACVAAAGGSRSRSR
ncbi:hypothetical protein FF100_34565 [Methylobacterium terricola]|uniref:Peptidase family M20/M25/M40 n=1 Tax=Methylobacterium terricola TaxID=2583531 RepID=A0A5C4L5C4_9HYPH|nr:hypothetical protein [Methylobacterium terricola]TNC06431.1 hypothetical protein FF100_34565 [Methylobacterium terricola]